jgi:hypothetical protein
MVLTPAGILERALDDLRNSTVTLNLGSERRLWKRTLPREPPTYTISLDETIITGCETYSNEKNALVWF